MNNECLSFSSFEKGQVAPSLEKELDMLGDGRTASIWSGLRTGYSEKPDFSHLLHSTHAPVSPIVCRVQFGRSPLVTSPTAKRTPM